MEQSATGRRRSESLRAKKATECLGAEETGLDHVPGDGFTCDLTQGTEAASYTGYLDRSGFIPSMGRRDLVRFALDHEVPYQYTGSGPSNVAHHRPGYHYPVDNRTSTAVTAPGPGDWSGIPSYTGFRGHERSSGIHHGSDHRADTGANGAEWDTLSDDGLSAALRWPTFGEGWLPIGYREDPAYCGSEPDWGRSHHTSRQFSGRQPRYSGCGLDHDGEYTNYAKGSAVTSGAASEWHTDPETNMDGASHTYRIDDLAYPSMDGITPQDLAQLRRHMDATSESALVSVVREDGSLWVRKDFDKPIPWTELSRF